MARTGEEQLRFWQHRLDHEGYVYVMQGQPGTPVKIGYAAIPQVRRDDLQTGYPDELHILHVLPGDREMETMMHCRFRGAHLRGEWFGGDELDYVLEELGALSERMIAAHDGSPQPPKVDWAFQIKDEPAFVAKGRQLDAEVEADPHGAHTSSMEIGRVIRSGRAG